MTVTGQDNLPALRQIAVIHTDFPEKFGIPRQSGLLRNVGEVVFEKPYRNPDAVRGMEEFSHLWLLWLFSASVREGYAPTVRPPRLGGNVRMGVFATRSPFRPNPIGLSSVRLLRVEPDTPRGPVLTVEGADLMDGTPILDIKPYLPFTDAHPDARDGFAGRVREDGLQVVFPPQLRARLEERQAAVLTALLAQDPRPHYRDDPERVFGFPYAGWEVRFTVREGVLTVQALDAQQNK